MSVAPQQARYRKFDIHKSTVSPLVAGALHRYDCEVMDESDFDGTLVLEQLAEIGQVEDFFDAIDADDAQRAVLLMKKAKIDASTIAVVVKKMEDGDGEH